MHRAFVELRDISTTVSLSTTVNDNVPREKIVKHCDRKCEWDSLGCYIIKRYYLSRKVFLCVRGCSPRYVLNNPPPPIFDVECEGERPPKEERVLTRRGSAPWKAFQPPPASERHNYVSYAPASGTERLDSLPAGEWSFWRKRLLLDCRAPLNGVCPSFSGAFHLARVCVASTRL